MSVIKTGAVAVIFGCLAQIGAHPSQSQPDGTASAVVQLAENCFDKIRADVASGLQTRLKSREMISSRDLAQIGALLNASAARLREAGFEEKLTRAAQQVGMVQTQIQAVLKDPGNKEIFAVGLEPERCLNHIKLERASGAILEKKIERLRSTIEELRQCAVILETVTPPEQLSERLKLRLTQLLGEWTQGCRPEDPADIEAAGTGRDGQLDAERLRPTGRECVDGNNTEPLLRPGSGALRAGVRPSSAAASLNTLTSGPVIERPADSRSEMISSPKDQSSTATKVVRMAQQKVSEKLILKFIAASNEPFGIKSADQILKLRVQGVSSPLIAAMLRRDDQLRASAAYNQ